MAAYAVEAVFAKHALAPAVQLSAARAEAAAALDEVAKLRAENEALRQALRTAPASLGQRDMVEPFETELPLVLEDI